MYTYAKFDQNTRDGWEVRRLLPENDNVTKYTLKSYMFLKGGIFFPRCIYQVNTFNSKEMTANNNPEHASVQQVTSWHKVRNSAKLFQRDHHGFECTFYVCLCNHLA